MKNTRILNNTAVDTTTGNIHEMFHPDIAAQFVECPDEVLDGWVITDGIWSAPPPPVPYVVPEPTVEELRDIAKAARAIAVAAITVTTAAGNTFDGDETSQTRMARAIIALQATGTPSINWVLADNSVIEASAAELSEALALAGAAQAALWVLDGGL